MYFSKRVFNSEEAKKLWHKQETRWIAEQEARNNLMRDVLVTIQKQVGT